MKYDQDQFIQEMIAIHKFCFESEQDHRKRSKLVESRRAEASLEGAAGAYGECEVRMRMAIERLRLNA